jgi:hypothetical protein
MLAIPNVLSQKFANIVGGLPTVMPRESGHPEAFDYPGFRVALAIASLPGMAPNYATDFGNTTLALTALPSLP